MTIGARSAVLQRRLKIADWIRQYGQMRVDELSAALKVSEVTIRGDLTYLEEQGLIVRSFGKAVAAKSNTPRDRPASAPLTRALLVPMLRRAQALIEPDQIVLIGPGPLATQAIPWLAEIPGLSVVLTNADAVPIARNCLDARIYLLGGEITVESGMIDGTQALRMLDHYALGWTIFEADALSADAALLLSAKPVERLAEAATRRSSRSVVLIGNPALSLERRTAQLPLANVSDVILPGPPSSRLREILIGAGFRPIETEGGSEAYFSSQPARIGRSFHAVGELS